MSVAEHLGIRLSEYDARIRTFIPRYDAMLDVAAEAVREGRRRSPVIVDLGIGSGALAARCLSRLPSARVTGIDEDAGMLALARERLPLVTTVSGDFVAMDLPRADAIVASLALHHVATPETKCALYRRCAAALTPGGLIVIADCYLARTAAARARHRLAWRRHLRRSYSGSEAAGFLRAWAKEDTYFRLADEMKLLDAAGFRTTVRWRRDSFAVIVGTRRSRSKIVAADHNRRIRSTKPRGEK